MSSFSSGWCRDWFRWREHKNPDDCVTEDDQQQRQLPLIKALTKSEENCKETSSERIVHQFLCIIFHLFLLTRIAAGHVFWSSYFKGVHTFFVSSLDHQNYSLCQFGGPSSRSRGDKEPGWIRAIVKYCCCCFPFLLFKRKTRLTFFCHHLVFK